MRSHTAILHIGHRTFKGFVINDVYSNIEITSKVLYLIEAYCDLITGSSLSMKIQIMGGKITENLGFKSLLWKVKFFLIFKNG